ncbi:uncharacterized protein LOC129905597 isoform X3 [Episyrphus balteatus]|uniref:uncharacterized protein LOC129905597 isoform X3 n=1 Tax=Episyrphus balteatus TaxID=286459 RepID=UPI0024857B19|nr:uncharacterized protein LOC129905597 isoform X3 [Episyrphus balteatus]
MGQLHGILFWVFGLILIINSELTLAQHKRSSSRITSSRSFGTNIKGSSSSSSSSSATGVNFDCPEEFGYYPHPNDCTQYYVCVFGGALLESCTGGLMYSHELQTCDWPRNVGCDIIDGGGASLSVPSSGGGGGSSSYRDVTPRVPQIKQQPQQSYQQQQQQQQINHRDRFGPTYSSSTPSIQSKPTIVQQYQPRQQQQQQHQRVIQAQVQTLPPPPELRVAPNPVITSRGQPKPLLDSHEDIAKLYADAHDTLPPVEEEESDRQQRVYRGQPSTVGQVQRDRDGIIHQASINAIPNHGKIGSFAYGAQINQYRVESSSQAPPPQQSGNIFISQQRPKIVENNNNNQNGNRNYYNTSYETQQQQQNYDPYYSVYDDEIDLYRDVEYSNQQQQQQQQQQQIHQQQQQQPQHQLRGKIQQQQVQQQQQQQQQSEPLRPTYRPEIITSPQPVRDTYISKPLQKPLQQESKPFGNQQSLIYNSDYDEDLIAQIEQDNEYDQPTRSPIREDRFAINTITDRPIVVSSTVDNDDEPFYASLSSTLGPQSNSGEEEDQDPYDIPYDPINEPLPPPPPTPQRTPVFVPKVISTEPNDEYSLFGDENESTTVATTTSTTTTSTTTTPRPTTTSTTIRSSTTITTTQTQPPPPQYETTQSTTSSKRTNNRVRGGSHSNGAEREQQPATVTNHRGTHPPRTRPTLKPSGTIVSKAQEFVDIYRNPPSRPEPLYPQPTPDKTAAKCRKDVCLLPDCYCGGKEIPADLPVESIPQIVLLTFDDSVNDLNKQLYTDLFEKGRVNPNGCPISATFYVSHEWTDYSQVQNLYSDGHEIASHTVSHSFGEQFSQKKWTREVAGQREILAAYGGVKLSDVRGMRAPFLSVGGNKMFKMLYDSNFTYDSSMPVYENRPPSWPYTLDYKIFHDCMIPPCPTKSYPGVWQVPMVMWQDLNGGRCSMGDACSNPGESDGVYKMIMKNFERHYTTNRAPFGLFYHAAWFTQPHHKEGFIKFLDAINSMPDVWILTNWQALQWVRDPTPISRLNNFQPFQCDFSDRPKRCNNPKVCNLWHKSGVRYMRTCQPCPDIYPWTGKTGIRSSRVDNDIEES